MRAYLIACVLLAACSVERKQAVGDGGVDAPGDGSSTGGLDTTITAAPGEFTRQTASTFEFTSSQPTATFMCSIDGETPVVCATPYTRVLSDGTHSFSVRAVVGGKTDDTPAESVWTIDTIAPQTTIIQGPPPADNSVMVTFTFTASEMNCTFECSLDGGSYSPCTPGQAFGPLADGPHSFAVRARDRADNVDAGPAVRAWTIDTRSPDTEIATGPIGATTSATASFTFFSPDAGAGATFQCSLDGSTFAACTSPHTANNLPDGAHTFAVRVRDVVGNFDPTPATRTWTVDRTPPESTITSGPMGTVPSMSAGFTFTASEPGTFECALDAAAFAACTSPVQLANLAQGPHTFAVRARDVAGTADPTPATRSWTVDTTPPETTITSGPMPVEMSPTATFMFTASEPGTFECSLDDAPPAACTSPATVMDLVAGPHTFAVRAQDAAGNVDATPATQMWTVQ